MDPDMVRQQEEAERATGGPAPKKPANGTAGGSLAQKAEPSLDAAEAAETIPEETAQPAPAEAPIAARPAAARTAGNPNRRPLPPVGTGRRPGEAPPQRRRVRGLVRLLAYTAGGGVVGAALGYLSVLFHPLVPAEQSQIFIAASAGGFALLFGLLHLLHYDHH